MPHHHPFQESFWSPTSSLDEYPNFSLGFSVLHGKLKQSMTENKVIIDYIRGRIAVEKSHAAQLAKLLPAVNPFDDGGGLKRCFEVVFLESQESTKEHDSRADNLFTTALDPLLKFSTRYERIIQQTKATVEAQMKQLDMLCKQMASAKQVYQTKCQALLSVQPNYTENTADQVQIASMVFTTRHHVYVWLHDIKEEAWTNKQEVLQWLTTKTKQHDALAMLKSLVEQDFLVQNEDQYMKTTPPAVENRTKGKFLKRWNSQQINQVELVSDMMIADKHYKEAVSKAEKMRTQVEQILFLHYEEMESLELERIQTIKQAFISVAASLSNTIPRCKETFDNMMLYQETLKPDKDVQLVVEQYRTGQFNPQPILYQNYFHGTAKDQLFGVSLEEITKSQCVLVPKIVSLGLSIIESGFSRLYDEEKKVVWTTTSLPLDRVHSARNQINHVHAIDLETLEGFDLLLLASIIRLYLMELPECLFTFELYEPIKLIYSNQAQQDQNSRLSSMSKLLATLPSSNYHTVMLLVGHFHTLVKQVDANHDLASGLAKTFSYTLLRPQVESKISAYERHAQRFIQELILHYDIIFTKESYKAQEENSNRPCIVIPNKRPSVSSMRSMGASLVIPMPSSSTLFEDPDDIISEMSVTPPLIQTTTKSSLDDLTSLDSFFDDED